MDIPNVHSHRRPLRERRGAVRTRVRPLASVGPDVVLQYAIRREAPPADGAHFSLLWWYFVMRGLLVRAQTEAVQEKSIALLAFEFGLLFMHVSVMVVHGAATRVHFAAFRTREALFFLWTMFDTASQMPFIKLNIGQSQVTFNAIGFRLRVVHAVMRAQVANGGKRLLAHIARLRAEMATSHMINQSLLLINRFAAIIAYEGLMHLFKMLIEISTSPEPFPALFTLVNLRVILHVVLVIIVSTIEGLVANLTRVLRVM